MKEVRLSACSTPSPVKCVWVPIQNDVSRLTLETDRFPGQKDLLERIVSHELPDMPFNDFVGLKFAKEQLRMALGRISSGALFDSDHEWTVAVLLMGPPGTLMSFQMLTEFSVIR